MATLAETLASRTAEAAPGLVERLSKGRIRCYACGHECPIPEGAALAACSTIVLLNLAGHPGMSVPFGTGADGLPVGVQVLAPTLGEPQMFRAASALERAMEEDAR